MYAWHSRCSRDSRWKLRSFSSRCVALLVLLSLPICVRAEMDVDTAASRFGQRPAVWGMHMSPDGQKASFLRMHPEGFPIAMVIDFETGKAGLILVSDVKKDLDLSWCIWANNTRVLCSYYGIQPFRGDFYTMDRLVAVDMDGKNSEVLAQRQQRTAGATHQAGVIDLLPDEPNSILMPIVEDYGQGVSKVDIYENKLQTLVRPKQTVWGYWSDGRGNPRLRLDYDRTYRDIQYRLAGETKWRQLHRSKPDDLDDAYWPVGFGDDPNALFVADSHDGRIAIFLEHLAEEESKRELVYSHPEVDINGFLRLGKFDRPIGVTYSTDRPMVHYFDAGIETIDRRIRQELPGMILTFLDESWDRRFYLLHASSDVSGGRYYRFDRESDALSLVIAQHPWLEAEPLAPMVPVSFPSDDGRQIPGYLTRLGNAGSGPRPAIILPHGGPSARDEWGYDWFVQFFASRGYAVLQANYRGSTGYGAEWEGQGAFRDWKRAMTDIEYGARYLVEQGIADPDRICAVGWSFGGYAALMSAIEYPSRYRCAVSIAGVTDPIRLVNDADGLARRATQALVGRDPEVIQAGSPKRRAEDVQVPILLVHAEKDVNVPFDHSVEMRKALKKKKKKVEFVEYDDDDHQLRKQRNRIDMLQKVGDFLDEHLVPAPRQAD